MDRKNLLPNFCIPWFNPLLVEPVISETWKSRTCDYKGLAVKDLSIPGFWYLMGWAPVDVEGWQYALPKHVMDQSSCSFMRFLLVKASVSFLNPRSATRSLPAMWEDACPPTPVLLSNSAWLEHLNIFPSPHGQLESLSKQSTHVGALKKKM